MDTILSMYKNRNNTTFDIDDFVSPFVDSILSDINVVINLKDNSTLKSSIQKSCTRELMSLAIKMLVTEAQIYKIEHNLHAIHMKDFIKTLLNNNELLHTQLKLYPFLFSSLYKQSIYITKSYKELFYRFENDKEELIDNKLIDKNDEILSIDREAGDGHQNNKKVMEINCTNTSIYYKPKNSNLTLLLFNIQKWIETNSNLQFYRYKILNKENYAYEEKVENVKVIYQRDIDHYYYNFGVTLGLIYLLNGSDYHFENIIAHKEYPVMIDNETLFNPTVSDINIHSHLLYSGMLPNPSTPFDFSALYGSFGNQTMQVEQIVKKNGEYFIEKQDFHLSKKKNKPIDTIDYTYIYEKERQNIIAGFTEIITIIIKNKNDFINYLKNIISTHYNFNNAKIRVVIRPSMFYAEILQKLLHPYNVKTNKTAADFINNSLYTLNLSEEFITSEREQLLNGDIPIFHLKMFENHLIESPSYTTEVTPYEGLIQKISNLSSLNIMLGKKAILSILNTKYQTF